MSCDQDLEPNQTPIQRKAQVRDAVEGLDRALRMRTIKPVIDKKTGAIAFAGWTADRAGVSDGCAYRILMTAGSAMAKQILQQAETLAGKKVNTHAGIHSHDGGNTWEGNH